jgi:APA family basic amino acid/polyamine antiporter
VTAGAASPALSRRIPLWLLTAYGVGVMVGAGIYVLVGVVAGQAGLYAPLAFLIAGLVALPSALSYAELASRMPEAAGEAAFAEAGFQSRAMAILVGLAIVVAAMVSAGAVLRGGVGYFTTLVPVAPWAAILAGGTLLTLVAIAGVLESLAFAALFTAVEVLGLLAVAAVGLMAQPVADWVTPPEPEWVGIAGAVALCFFAFIGFEDIENMGEEVRDPRRNLPRAILLSLAITAVLYALVSLAAVRAVPRDALRLSEQPLALVWQRATGQSPAFLSAIAVAAAVNGVLAQIVMAARVLYGLGRRAAWLAPFHEAHPRFHTPLRGSLLVGAVAIGAALALPVAALAEVTAAVILGVFLLVNVALILLKRRVPEAPFRVPFWVPVSGLLLSLAALAAQGWGAG